MSSILRKWVENLPIRAQGTLLTIVRCCDVAPKNLLHIDEERFGCSTSDSSAERQLHAFLRWVILVPADTREVDIPGAWFRSRIPDSWKPSQFGHYPLHWYMHLMHAYEVVAYLHEDGWIKDEAMTVYCRLVSNLHLKIETKEEMLERLIIDRIAAKEVVS